MLRGRKYENVLGLPEQAGPGRGFAAVGPTVRSSPMFIPLPPPADQTHQRPRTGATTEGVQRRDCSFQPAKEMDRAWEERRREGDRPWLVQGRQERHQGHRARPSREASWAVPWVPRGLLGPGEVLNLPPG